MTISEIKSMNKRISQLSARLARLRAEAVNISPSVSDMPMNVTDQDKLGRCVAEISDTEREFSELRARRDIELDRLSKDIAEENCIWLFLVKRYTWRHIAQLIDGRPDTADSIRMRCYRYKW